VNPHENHQGTSWPQRAFTIIELLTVMATMSLLASLLWPAVQQGDGTLRPSPASQLRQWGVGFSLFVDEHENTVLNALWPCGPILAALLRPAQRSVPVSRGDPLRRQH